MDLRKIVIFTAVAVIGTMIGTTGTALAEKPKVAILGLEVVEAGGLDAKIVKLATSLTGALRKRASVGAGPYKLEPKGNKELLEMKLLGGCGAKPSRGCMSRIGKDLSVGVMIYGKLQKRKKGYQITLNLLDVKKKQMIRTKSEMIGLDDTSPARVNEWARRLYNRLTGVPEQGTIAINANVQTGQVFINGEVKGQLADGKREITGVAEGTMEVRIESDGHNPYATEVTVKGGKTVTIEANLAEKGSVVPPKPKEPGSTDRILFWSSAVVAAGGVVLASVQGLQISGHEKEKLDAIDEFQENPDTQLDVMDACGDAATRLGGNDTGNATLERIVDACDSGSSSALFANVGWGIAGVGAAAAGYFFYKGYIAAKKSKNTETAKKRAKPGTNVVVTPTVLPTYVGAGVKIEF